ncbi:MAG: recombinase family protein, partial [Vulcanibacillus sp.]
PPLLQHHYNIDIPFCDIFSDIKRIFVTNDSGTSMKSRDRLQDLLRKVYAGHIDLVLVKSLSRFAKNTIDALPIIKETRKLGVEFYFEKEGIYSLDPAIDILFIMMASMAEQESGSMSQKISWSFQKQAQKGKVSLHKCIGYTLTKDKKFVINKDEAPIVRKVFQMKIDGSSNKDIFEVMVVVDLENYVFVINASGKKTDTETFKKVTEIKPLLQSRCKSKTNEIQDLNWFIVLN